MTVRAMRSIVTNDRCADAGREADVIVSATAIGFAASIVEDGRTLRFDIGAEDRDDPQARASLQGSVSRIDAATAGLLRAQGAVKPGSVRAGVSPEWEKGAVIMGVYELAGVERPPQTQAGPSGLSEAGRELWDRISRLELPQYTGVGAYTGFVDNHNTEGDTRPVGPRSTARFIVTDLPKAEPRPHSRWLPTGDSPLWASRTRLGGDSRVSWGMIGGEFAGQPPKGAAPVGVTNRADQITYEMEVHQEGQDGMVFVGDPGGGDVVGYTHGMIQAIYKAYDAGPSCVPYEIAVGPVTRKLASCLPCTFFMYATGYPPTSIHLGRGDSWVPLYGPYPAGDVRNEIMRDLNSSWYRRMDSWLRQGVTALGDVEPSHVDALAAVSDYLDCNKDVTVAATLVLDAVSIHGKIGDRINRTLQPRSG